MQENTHLLYKKYRWFSKVYEVHGKKARLCFLCFHSENSDERARAIRLCTEHCNWSVATMAPRSALRIVLLACGVHFHVAAARHHERPRRALLQHLPIWHPRHGDRAAAQAELQRSWGAHPLFASGGGGGGGGYGAGAGAGGGGDWTVSAGDESGRSHAEVVARHARRGGTADAAPDHEKQPWGLGSRMASAFFETFNPRHEAARRAQGMTTFRGHSHEGVHALDWFGHKAAEERQRLTDEEIEQQREAVRAKVCLFSNVAWGRVSQKCRCLICFLDRPHIILPPLHLAHEIARRVARLAP